MRGIVAWIAAALFAASVASENELFESSVESHMAEVATTMSIETEAGSDWSAFELAELEARRKESKRAYLEFLRESTLNCGLYVLPKNSVDKQTPHAEDEVYYIISGKATLKVDGKERAVKPGSVVFVKRGIDHSFHAIEEELHVLVFFSAAKPDK